MNDHLLCVCVCVCVCVCALTLLVHSELLISGAHNQLLSPAAMNQPSLSFSLSVLLLPTYIKNQLSLLRQQERYGLYQLFQLLLRRWTGALNAKQQSWQIKGAFKERERETEREKERYRGCLTKHNITASFHMHTIITVCRLGKDNILLL